MPNREQQILDLIRDNPMLPQQTIADQLGISRSAVAGHIMHLTNKGVIKGRGYVVSDTPFVTVVGGSNIDIHGKSYKPLRGKDSNPGKVHTSAGGVARNIAENLARLGVDCRLISAVGDDHHGRMLLRLSRDAGIDTKYVHQIEAATTSTYMSLLDDSGDMQLGIADMSVIERLTAERLQPRLAMLQQSSLIVLDANLPHDALAWLTSSITNTPIFVDTVSTTKALRLQPHLQSIHTLKASAIEAEALTGLEARTQKQLHKLAEHLHAKGVERLFITRGEKGVYYSTNEGQSVQKLDRGSREIRNAGGAGDALLAGLAYAWLQNWSLEQSIQFSLAAADVTLSDSGTTNPALTLAAVMQAMES
jgi:pseudouridine kinase